VFGNLLRDRPKNAPGARSRSPILSALLIPSASQARCWSRSSPRNRRIKRREPPALASMTAAVMRALAKLGELPKPAAEETRSLEDAKREIASLRREIAAKPKPPADEAAIAARIEQAVAGAIAKERRERAKELREALHHMEGLQARRARVQALVDDVFGIANNVEALLLCADQAVAASPSFRPAQSAPARPIRYPERSEGSARSDSPLPIGERRILTAAAQYEDGVTREQLTILTGYKRSSRDAYIQRLREKGFIDTPPSGRIIASQEGIDALGPDFEPLPTGDALLQWWLPRLPEGERRILEALIPAFPDAVPRALLSETVDYKRSSRDAYIQRLRARRLVEIEGGGVRAAKELFD
jgi:hypothetical protein